MSETDEENKPEDENILEKENDKTLESYENKIMKSPKKHTLENISIDLLRENISIDLLRENISIDLLREKLIEADFKLESVLFDEYDYLVGYFVSTPMGEKVLYFVENNKNYYTLTDYRDKNIVYRKESNLHTLPNNEYLSYFLNKNDRTFGCFMNNNFVLVYNNDNVSKYKLVENTNDNYMLNYYLPVLAIKGSELVSTLLISKAKISEYNIFYHSIFVDLFIAELNNYLINNKYSDVYDVVFNISKAALTKTLKMIRIIYENKNTFDSGELTQREKRYLDALIRSGKDHYNIFYNLLNNIVNAAFEAHKTINYIQNIDETFASIGKTSV